MTKCTVIVLTNSTVYVLQSVCYALPPTLLSKKKKEEKKEKENAGKKQ